MKYTNLKITTSCIFLLITIFIFSDIPLAHATNYYTQQNGKWQVKKTWLNNNKPNWIGNGDTVFIQHDITSNSTIGIGTGEVLSVDSSGSLTGNSNLQLNNNAKVLANSNIDIKKLDIYGGEFKSTGNVNLSGLLNTSAGSQIMINGDFTIDHPGGGNIIGLNSTSVEVDGNFSVNNGILQLNWNSTLITNGSASVNGSITLNNSTITSHDKFLTGGNLTLNSNSSITNNGDFTTNGNVTLWGSSNIDNNDTITSQGTVYNDGTINNSGTWNVNNDLTNGWSGNIVNSGDLLSSSDIINKNQIDNTGNIEVDGNFTNDWGSSYVNNGTTFVDGDLDNNGTISGSGNTLITGTLNTSNGQVTGDGYVCNPDHVTDPTGGNQSNIDTSVTICGQKDDNTYPVELIEFTAENTENAIKLHWVTASEINNAHFTVQRSTDNNQFTDVATIPGAGTSNKIINYSYRDRNCPAGENVYYRIKQTDYDGSKSYSRVIDIKNRESLNIKLFPNPVNKGNQVTIQSSEKELRLKIYNQQGSLVKEINQFQHQNCIKTGNLESGLYLIKVDSENISQPITKKLIVR